MERPLLTLARIAATLAASAALLGCATARAQAFPDRPVKIVTGGAGTFHDIVARQLARRLSVRWSQPVVIENQPGAGLTIGTGMVAHARPDGYTLVLSDRSALAVAPWLLGKLPYDVQTDLVPITRVAVAPSILVTTPDFPARDLRELIAYVKQRPERIHYATAGPGTASHVTGALLNFLGGTRLVLVPYKGGGPVIAALLGHEVEMSTGLVPAVLPQVRAGRLKGLAITSDQRLPGFVSNFWVGLLAPARTPEAIIRQLNRDVAEALGTPDLRAALLEQGAEPAAGTPREFADFIRAESASMKHLIEATGMRAGD